jgi:hypothetical protein
MAQGSPIDELGKGVDGTLMVAAVEAPEPKPVQRFTVDGLKKLGLLQCGFPGRTDGGNGILEAGQVEPAEPVAGGELQP